MAEADGFILPPKVMAEERAATRLMIINTATRPSSPAAAQ